MDPKGGELFLKRFKLGEILAVDLCDTDVQFVHFILE